MTKYRRAITSRGRTPGRRAGAVWHNRPMAGDSDMAAVRDLVVEIVK
jgi:hypothetical protein